MAYMRFVTDLEIHSKYVRGEPAEEEIRYC